MGGRGETPEATLFVAIMPVAVTAKLRFTSSEMIGTKSVVDPDTALGVDRGTRRECRAFPTRSCGRAGPRVRGFTL